MMELSHNNIFVEKERKNKKENDEFSVFEVKRFRTPVIVLQVLTIRILLATLQNTW